MKRKLFALLLPVVAVVAFASMTGAAQAAPHWYICKHEAAATHEWSDSACSVASAKKGEYERVRLPFNEAEKTAVTTFGVLTLESGGATATCSVSDRGKVWNTLLANPGLDEITAFENYECTSNFCTAGLSVTTAGVPWPTELIAGPPIKDKIGTAGKPVKVTLACTTPATNDLFEGTLEPEWVNGTQANGGTSFVNFAKTPGLKTSGGVTATVSGKDYTIGTVNAEQILVLNP
jgi:hypothetical protein